MVETKQGQAQGLDSFCFSKFILLWTLCKFFAIMSLAIKHICKGVNIMAEYSMLDYMTRGIEWNKRLDLVDMLDPHQNTMMFNFLIVKFLKDPYTTNEFILLAIPNHDDPAVVEGVREKYRQHFAKINQMCIENGIYPFFKDPNDLKECEQMRELLIREWPEWLMNESFKVNGYHLYTPPAYDPNVPNPYDKLLFGHDDE